jgi:hypothetical protein
MQNNGGGALCAGADPFAPVILVGEAAARPADVGDLQVSQCGDHVVADAASVRNGRIGANPDAFIKSVAEILGELAEDVAIDLRAGF